MRQPRSWPSIVGSPERRGSRALARLEDITRLVSEWVWETDAEGALTFVSNRATEILGLIPAQLIGRKMSELEVAPVFWTGCEERVLGLGKASFRGAGHD